MPVVKADIKTALEALYATAAAGMSDADFADGMAGIIQDAILSANVKIGTAVATPDTLVGATTAIGVIE